MNNETEHKVIYKCVEERDEERIEVAFGQQPTMMQRIVAENKIFSCDKKADGKGCPADCPIRKVAGGDLSC